MGREVELKFSATPAVLKEIYSKWQNWEEISMQTTYFDTADGCLSAKHCTLRCRMENGISVCTMKTPTDGYGRGEWDTQTPWNEETAKKLFIAANREQIPFEKLLAVCGARFTRLVKTVQLPDCTVEIALDQGVLLGGGKEIPLCEMEVELKSGSEKAAVEWAGKLAAQYDLKAEHKSKFCRAAMLAQEA